MKLTKTEIKTNVEGQLRNKANKTDKNGGNKRTMENKS